MNFPISRRALAPLLFIVSSCTLIAAGTATAYSQDPSLPPPEIRVGLANDNYPWSFRTDSGDVQGFVVDVVNAVASSLNMKVKLIASDGPGLNQLFARGQIDCIAFYSYSPRRSEQMDFSIPYLTLHGSVFVKSGSRYHTLADLAGKRFAVVGANSSTDIFLDSAGIGAERVRYPSSTEMLRRVESGECDAAFTSRLTAYSLFNHLKIQDIVPLPQSYAGYEIKMCFALHKGDASRLALINDGLALINSNGQFAAIYRKWFGWIDSPLVTGPELVALGVAVLALGFLAAVAGYARQRKLRANLAAQAAEIERQRALLHALFENVPLALSLLELAPSSPRLISCNRAALRLYSLDPGVSGPLGALSLSEGVRGHFDEVLKRSGSAEAIIHYDWSLSKENRMLEVTLVPLPAAEDSPRRVCVIAEDTSARKLMDAEMAHSRRLRAVGELVGGIAHEFNNLLTPVMLKVGEIQMDWSADERLQQEISVIAQAARRSAELTRRLLTFGRKTASHLEPVRLSAAVANCFDLLRHTVDRRIVWESAIPSDLPAIDFNPTDLNQIVLNLLLNARDTLLEKLERPPGGDWVPRIRVMAALLPPSAVAPGKNSPEAITGWQRLSIQDNGQGMRPNVVERIFEPFYTTKDAGKGTGLGLATVWHIVNEAGGRIDVESTPGAGTTFHVMIPMHGGTSAPGAQKSEADRPREMSRIRVLLVEDEELVATTIVAMLKRKGHQVRHIADGAEAWLHVSGDMGAYDLLIIDVNLPGMNGIELVRRLKEERFPGRIFVVSGRLGMVELRSLIQLHVDRVLTKPFSLEQFEQALRECMSQEAPKGAS